MALRSFILPYSITIYEVGQIVEELNQLPQPLDGLTLNGSEVEEVDTAGIQLLFWLNQQYAIKLQACSPSLQKRLGFLGLDQLMRQ